MLILGCGHDVWVQVQCKNSKVNFRLCRISSTQPIPRSGKNFLHASPYVRIRLELKHDSVMVQITWNPPLGVTWFIQSQCLVILHSMSSRNQCQKDCFREPLCVWNHLSVIPLRTNNFTIIILATFLDRPWSRLWCLCECKPLCNNFSVGSEIVAFRATFLWNSS